MFLICILYTSHLLHEWMLETKSGSLKFFDESWKGSEMEILGILILKVFI